jgi:hypothetical protein
MKTGIRGQRSEIRDQGSEIRDQGSGVRDQRSGIRDQGSEIRDQGSVFPSGLRVGLGSLRIATWKPFPMKFCGAPPIPHSTRNEWASGRLLGNRMKTSTMRNVGGWMFFASVVLLFLDACFYYVSLLHGEGSFLTMFLEIDVFLAAICVGAPGGILWTAGWIVDEIKKKAP